MRISSRTTGFHITHHKRGDPCVTNIGFQGGHAFTWWRHQMEAVSALLAICAGNSPVTGKLPAQRPVTRSFGVFFDLCVNKLLSKRSRVWWFETPQCPLWRHCKDKEPVHRNGTRRASKWSVIVEISSDVIAWTKVSAMGFKYCNQGLFTSCDITSEHCGIS